MTLNKAKPRLKRISFILLLFLLLLAPISISQDFSNLYKDVSSSVVIVTAYDSNNNPISQGSGFFINKDGDIITNFHVVGGSDKIEIETSDGINYSVKNPLSVDITGDLFLATVDIPSNVVHPLELDTVIPKIGEDIIVIGCPEGLSQTMTRGIVSAIRDLEDYGTVIQIDAAISPGSSGSPVINKKGEVIGLATFHRKEGQNLNFAISSKKLSNFIGNISKADSFELWLSKGVALYSLGKYDESIKAFDEVINLNPNKANGTYSKGLSLHRLGRYEEALSAYNEAIRIDPNHTKALAMKGTVLRDMGKFDEAINSFQEAIGLDASNAATWNNLGTTLGDQLKYEEAIDALNEAIKIDPDFAGAWHNKGLYLYNQGKLDEALKASEISLILDPNDAENWFNEGNILTNLSMYDEAISAYDECIKINPKDKRPWIKKGYIFETSEKLNEAIKAYNQVIGIDPYDKVAWNKKGIVLGKLEKFDDAIEAFDEAIRLDPNFIEAKENRKIALKLRGNVN